MRARGLDVDDAYDDDDGDSLADPHSQAVASARMYAPRASAVASQEPNRSSATSLEQSTVWRKEFFLLRERFPRHMRSMMSLRSSGFKITDYYADGTFTGTYTAEVEVFSIFASLEEPPIGCNCQRSNGQYVCEHAWGFVEKIISELGSNSEVAKRVNAHQFSPGKLDRSRFQFDETNSRLNRLACFLEVQPTETSVALPPIETVQRERVGWQVQMNPNVNLTLTVQALAKRGDRWKKGRSTTVQALDPAAERSAADLAVLRIF